jgi:hypothetical protein
MNPRPPQTIFTRKTHLGSRSATLRANCAFAPVACGLFRMSQGAMAANFDLVWVVKKKKKKKKKKKEKERKKKIFSEFLVINLMLS